MPNVKNKNTNIIKYFSRSILNGFITNNFLLFLSLFIVFLFVFLLQTGCNNKKPSGCAALTSTADLTTSSPISYYVGFLAWGGDPPNPQSQTSGYKKLCPVHLVKKHPLINIFSHSTSQAETQTTSVQTQPQTQTQTQTNQRNYVTKLIELNLTTDISCVMEMYIDGLAYDAKLKENDPDYQGNFLTDQSNFVSAFIVDKNTGQFHKFYLGLQDFFGKEASSQELMGHKNNFNYYNKIASSINNIIDPNTAQNLYSSIETSNTNFLFTQFLTSECLTTSTTDTSGTEITQLSAKSCITNKSLVQLSAFGLLNPDHQIKEINGFLTTLSQSKSGDLDTTTDVTHFSKYNTWYDNLRSSTNQLLNNFALTQNTEADFFSDFFEHYYLQQLNNQQTTSSELIQVDQSPINMVGVSSSSQLNLNQMVITDSFNLFNTKYTIKETDQATPSPKLCLSRDLAQTKITSQKPFSLGVFDTSTYQNPQLHPYLCSVFGLHFANSTNNSSDSTTNTCDQASPGSLDYQGSNAGGFCSNSNIQQSGLLLIGGRISGTLTHDGGQRISAAQIFHNSQLAIQLKNAAITSETLIANLNSYLSSQAQVTGGTPQNLPVVVAEVEVSPDQTDNTRFNDGVEAIINNDTHLRSANAQIETQQTEITRLETEISNLQQQLASSTTTSEDAQHLQTSISTLKNQVSELQRTKASQQQEIQRLKQEAQENAEDDSSGC